LIRRAHIKNAPPNPGLRIEPQALGLVEFSREFFRLDTAHIAREIIGAWFARRFRNQWYGARIVETEAYLGPIDAAAHTYQGRRTARVESMYMDGGHLYVFFVYGMHYCANIVTRPEGEGEAVLLRAAEGPPGAPARLLSGPGKLCKALGITTASTGSDLLSGGDLRLFRRCGEQPQIDTSRRVGVDYAGEAAAWPLRFFDKNSPSVSHLRLKIYN
jgi:DNA-3-methyladenine glycosylase